MVKGQRNKKRMFVMGCLLLAISVGFQGCSFERIKNIVHRMKEEISLPPINSTLVTETEEDLRVIPDKYNTGVTGELAVVGLGDMVEGIQLKADGTGTKNVMDFYYGNQMMSGTVVIENMDFSEHPLVIYHSDRLEKQITLVFNNCKFSTMSTGRTNNQVLCEFNHCTFQSFYGSDVTFNRCKFGDHYSDGIVPFQNVCVQDSFFSNMSVVKEETGELHSDGTQLYGYADVPVRNVSYENCRFEIPSIELTGSNAYVNACFMLQLEFADASNISVKNCILNGGGYSIYAWSKIEEYTMKNVVLQNVKVGCAKKFGTFYPKISREVVVENVVDTDCLYVASVWKENNQTHFSVTNDTNQERELLILTDKGQFSYRIPACPRGNELVVDSRYKDLPFDLDIVIPVDCEYAVCYDNLLPGAARQIRFVNWTGKRVYLAEEDMEKLFSSKEGIWHSGQCGEDVWYELDKEGCLTLGGNGATYNFHSAKRAPWYEYREYVRTVIIEEGVAVLGAQIFKDCTSLQKVTLPRKLLEISSRAFDGCVALQGVYWPDSLQTVGEQAFMYQFMDSVQYGGTDAGAIVTDTEELDVVVQILEYVSNEEETMQAEKETSE